MGLLRRLVFGNAEWGDSGAVQPRDRLQQPPRVGVRRPLKQVLHRGGLDDEAGVHHGDPVGQVADDAEVVADIDDRVVLLPAQGPDHVEQTRLRRRIETCSRFIQDQDGRINASAIAIATRWFWPPLKPCG